MAETRERRAWAVVALTVAMMVAELVAGHLSRSLALTADGWHMGTHAGALTLTALAYWYARRHAGSGTFSLGTHRINTLAGFTSSIILSLIALAMVVESVRRLLAPESIQFDEAIGVAVVGLVANVLSALLLGHDHGPGHSHGHTHGAHASGDHGHDHAHGDHDHGHHDHGHGHHDHGHHDHGHHAHGHHAHGDHDHGDHDHGHDGHDHDHRAQGHHTHARGGPAPSHDEPARDDPAHDDHALDSPALAALEAEQAVLGHGPGGHEDHNLRAAYLHVLADALTSVLAIVALLGGKYAGLGWLDPVMGVVGGLLVLRWGAGLSRETARALLDVTPDAQARSRLEAALAGRPELKLHDLRLVRVEGEMVALVSVTGGEPAVCEQAVRRATGVRQVFVERRQ